MNVKIIRPERRKDYRQGRLGALGEAVEDTAWAERRTHCWDLEAGCTEERRKRCSAHFVRRNCWDLWAAEYFPPGRKPCCHSDLDCSECAVATAKFGKPISVYLELPPRSTEQKAAPSTSSDRAPGYCVFLYSTREPGLARGDGDAKIVFKCQRRRGIVLHGSYVSEMCGTPGHGQCSFHDSE